MTTLPPAFDTGGFLRYLCWVFPSVDRSYYVQRLIENLICYAEAYKNHGRDEMCDFLSELLPDVSFGEIAAFAPDELLTPSYGQAEKCAAIRDEPKILNFRSEEG